MAVSSTKGAITALSSQIEGKVSLGRRRRDEEDDGGVGEEKGRKRVK